MSADLPAVVVVDDNEIGRYAVTRVLENAGYSVAQGGTGAEALRLARAQPLAMIVDVNLPDMTGIEVCRHIKSDTGLADIVVILSSATSTEVHHRVLGLEGGADGYLIQPVESLELVATVKAHVRLRSVTRRARRLQQVTTALSSVSDELIAGRLVAEACRAAIGASTAAVALQAVRQEQVDVIYHVGYQTSDPWRAGTSAEALLVLEAIRSGEAVFNSEVSDLAAPPGAKPAPAQAAYAVAPLRAFGAIQGALWMGFQDDHLFTSDEQAFVLTLANQLSVTISRARAQAAQYRAWAMAEGAAARATALADVSQILADISNPSAAYQAVTARVLPVLGDYCGLYLLGGDGALQLAALSILDVADVPPAPGIFAAAAEAWAPWLAWPGHATRVAVWDGPGAKPDEGSWPAGLSKLVAQLQPTALIIAPLVIRGALVGALLLGRSTAGRAYSPDDVQAAREMAYRAAAAVDTANLLEEAQSLNRRLEERVQARTAALEAQIQERLHIERELDQSREQLRSFSARLQSAREEEQLRLSRELHDELGGALTGLKMDVALIERHLPPSSEEIRASLKRLSQTLDQNIKTVRQIATRLRPGILDDFGLPAALEWQLDEFAARTGVDCHLETLVAERDWDQAAAITLFRIFQEALTNIARHAGATRVDARLEEKPGEIILTIHDNGRGMPAEQGNHATSLGLMGMRERTHAIGGRFQIQSPPGYGTKVVVTIPDHRPARP